MQAFSSVIWIYMNGILIVDLCYVITAHVNY